MKHKNGPFLQIDFIVHSLHVMVGVYQYMKYYMY